MNVEKVVPLLKPVNAVLIFPCRWPNNKVFIVNALDSETDEKLLSDLEGAFSGILGAGQVGVPELHIAKVSLCDYLIVDIGAEVEFPPEGPVNPWVVMRGIECVLKTSRDVVRNHPELLKL